MDARDCYEHLADFIRARKVIDRALIVGINGVDGSGKTILADNLARALEGRGFPVVRVSVDGFHHPRRYRYRRGERSSQGYYHDSIDYEALADALRPACAAQTYPVECQTKRLDLASDSEDVRSQMVDENTIVLAEGVFIFRPEIAPYLQVKIFIDADFDTILRRVQIRDLATLGSEERIRQRYEQKYIPGQQLYFAAVQPKRLADLVIDNNDFSHPRITYVRP